MKVFSAAILCLLLILNAGCRPGRANVQVPPGEPTASDPLSSLADEFFSRMLLEESERQEANLESRAALTEIRELHHQNRDTEALQRFKDYFFDKLRHPERYGFDRHILDPYTGWHGVLSADSPGKVIAGADRLMNGVISFGGNEVDIGPPGTVNWNHPFARDEAVPFDEVPAMVGISRFNILIQAYQLTRNEVYLRRWAEYIDDWAMHSTYADGVHPCVVPTNFGNPLLPTLKLLVLIAGLEPAERDIVPAATVARLLNRTIRDHSLQPLMYIRSNCHNWTPDTAVYMEAAMLLDEFKAAPMYFRESRRRCVEDIAVTQHLRDGSETQQDVWYNPSFLRTKEAIRFIDARAVVPLRDERPWIREVRLNDQWKRQIYEHLGERLQYLMRLVTPQQVAPIPFRADTRGAGISVSDGNYLRNPAFFDRPETRALMAAFSDPDSGIRPSYTSEWFPYGGYNIVRDGWERDSGYGAMFCSPKPGAYGGRRSRSNNNTFGLNAWGEDLVVDAEGGKYNERPSALTVDGHLQQFHARVYSVPDPSGHKTTQVSAWTEPAPWRWHASEHFNLMEGVYAGPYGDRGQFRFNARRGEAGERLVTEAKGARYTDIGLEMVPRGHRLLASAFLHRAGVPVATVRELNEQWLDLPDVYKIGKTVNSADVSRRLGFGYSLTAREYETLDLYGRVTDKILGMRGWIYAGIERAVRETALKPDGPYETIEAVFEAGRDQELADKAKALHATRLRAALDEANALDLVPADDLRHLAEPPRNAPAIDIRSGQKVAFFGGAVMHDGGRDPIGWCKLIYDGLTKQGRDIEPVWAGSRTDTMADIRARLDWVLAEEPDWLIVNFGAKDLRDVKEEAYPATVASWREHMAAILDASAGAGVRPIATAVPMPFEDAPLEHPANLAAVEMNDWLEAEAARRGIPFVDFSTPLRKGRANDNVAALRDEYTRRRDYELIEDVTHQRQALYLREEKIWIVTDRLLSPAPHRYEQLWYFPFRTLESSTNKADQIVVNPDRQTIRMMADTRKDEWRTVPACWMDVMQFSTANLRYDYRPDYKMADRAEVAVTFDGRGNEQVVTLFHPMKPGTKGQEAFQQVKKFQGRNGATGFAAQTHDGKVIFYLSSLDQAQSMKAGPVQAVAETLLISGDRVLVLGCRELALNGRPVEIRTADFEFSLSSGFSPLAIYRPIDPVSISPARNVFVDQLDVELSSRTPGVEIRYTLDGTDVTPQSALYREPIHITEDTVVRARAYRPGVNENPVQTSGTHATPVTFAVFDRAELRPAAAGGTAQPGLRYRYYEADWKDLWLSMEELTPVAQGEEARLFDLGIVSAGNPPIGRAAAPRRKYFGVVYEGRLHLGGHHP